MLGEGAGAFADALRAGLAARGVEATRVELRLRHAPGFATIDGALHAHPDATAEALAPLRGALAIGVGEAFAAAVRADLVIWITGGHAPASLPTALRPIAAAARLRLRRPDEAVARALAERWPPPDPA